MQIPLIAALVFALALTLTAAPMQAEGCHDPVKMSCTEGAIWDEVRQVCAPKPVS